MTGGEGQSAKAGEATVIDIRGLSLTFETNDGPVEALSNINLDVRRGEFVSFIGPSGCGKTTLLRVIADLEQPTGGSITARPATESSSGRRPKHHRSEPAPAPASPIRPRCAHEFGRFRQQSRPHLSHQ